MPLFLYLFIHTASLLVTKLNKLKYENITRKNINYEIQKESKEIQLNYKFLLFLSLSLSLSHALSATLINSPYTTVNISTLCSFLKEFLCTHVNIAMLAFK